MGIGGFLQSQWNFRITCWVGAGISLCNFLFAVVFLKETKSGPELQVETQKQSLVKTDIQAGEDSPKISGIQALITVYKRNGHIAFVLLAFFLAQFGWTAFNSMFTLYATQKFGVSISQISLVFTEFAVAVIITQIFVTSPVIKLFGEKWSTFLGSLLRAGGLFAVVYMPNFGSLIACVTLVAISGALINPCLNALVSHFSDKNTHGGIMGLNQLMGSFARGLAPPFCGLLYDMNPGWPFQFFGTIAMVLCSLALLPLVPPKTSHKKYSKIKPAINSESTPNSVHPQRPILEDDYQSMPHAEGNATNI